MYDAYTFPPWFEMTSIISLLASVKPGFDSTELALGPNTINECAFHQSFVLQPFFDIHNHIVSFQQWFKMYHLLRSSNSVEGMLQ